MANEIFNVNGVKKAMEDLQTKFSDFADILAEANGYVETVINVTDDSAVYGNYGTKLQSIWDQNYVTFDNFHKNFESWAEVVSLISANNIDFTVSAESVYRDNAGTLDGIQGARTIIKESGGRNNVDVDSVHDSDVNKVLSYMSDYVLDESAGNNGSEGTGTDSEDTTEPFYTISVTDAGGIKKNVKIINDSLNLEIDNLNSYLNDLIISKSALTANKDSYTDAEYAEKIKTYDEGIEYLSKVVEQRISARDLGNEINNAGDTEALAMVGDLEKRLTSIPSYQDVVNNVGGPYQNLNSEAIEEIYGANNPYSQSMICSTEDCTTALASKMTLENAYDLAVRNDSALTDGNVTFFNTYDYLQSAYTKGTEAYERQLNEIGSVESNNFRYGSQVTYDGHEYDSVAYKNPDTGKIEFYSVEEWKKRSEAQ